MNKGIWMAKAADGDLAFDNPSTIEPKRSHQWFVDTDQPELFPNKKQALETPNSVSNSGISENVPSWDNPSSFQSVSNQFIHRLFGPETVDSPNYVERTTCPETDDSNASVSLSISHVLEDPEACLNYGGFKKVKINEVKDSENNFHDQRELDFINKNSEIPTSQGYSRENENFITIRQAYGKEDDNVTLMGHSYNGDAHIVSSYMKEDDNIIPINETYSKEETHMISFGEFHDAHDMIPVGKLISSYGQSYDQSLVQTPNAVHGKELDDASDVNATASSNKVAKIKAESVSRSKAEVKSNRKEAPNSFPSNVRSLISTGMLDGVPVKYVSMAREELRGIIKGSGYLCSCESCNYSKVLNAYEFERHAGCKTKHPNNHIYFENGKTIYQIVQELRSTPESMLFDVIQTVFGAPLNQKSFRIWKESFQAATRELQRIYGKEELNL
ncbi:Acyl-CoA N-acyltransferase with RING/FYVE/PHD-type zinc finger domain [Euphorbia peplus]|nr:Acyl-CoA N-acyltransferase with RING/FYVE/PHD-type zinc finger domain [Euphorbia peplus]